MLTGLCWLYECCGFYSLVGMLGMLIGFDVYLQEFWLICQALETRTPPVSNGEML